jgi:hypothetical protein
MKAKYELSSSNTFATQLQETLAKEQESSLKIGKMLQEREQEYYVWKKSLRYCKPV